MFHIYSFPCGDILYTKNYSTLDGSREALNSQKRQTFLSFIRVFRGYRHGPFRTRDICIKYYLTTCFTVAQIKK